MSPLPLHALRKNTRSHDSHPNAPGKPRNELGDVARGRIEALLADLGSQLQRGESLQLRRGESLQLRRGESLQLLRGESLASRDREQPSRCSCGVSEIDRLLEGGFPRGRLSEISGPPSSGRTSLALALLAATTRSGELAAVVDRTDAFDPPSAERAGVDLKRVLWVRALTWREALRCTERLLETDGFPLVVLDLASRQRERATTAAWVRLARLAASTQTAVVLLSVERLAGSHVEIALEMQPVRARFTGTPALLEELEARAVLVRHRTAPADREASLRLACAEETGPTTPR